MALTEAQKRAKQKWQKKNRDKQNLYNLRSKAKTFITENATLEELIELEDLIAERKEKLTKEEK